MQHSSCTNISASQTFMLGKTHHVLCNIEHQERQRMRTNPRALRQRSTKATSATASHTGRQPQWGRGSTQQYLGENNNRQPTEAGAQAHRTMTRQRVGMRAGRASTCTQRATKGTCESDDTRPGGLQPTPPGNGNKLVRSHSLCTLAQREVLLQGSSSCNLDGRATAAWCAAGLAIIQER